MATRLKRPRDPIQLGKPIVDIATGQNHAHSVAIHFMPYNFVRIHQSLRGTPAIAAGVTTKLWALTDMVRDIEEWEAQNAPKLADRLVV